METTKEQKQSKVPIVEIDETMQNLDGRIYFPEKIAATEEMLRTVGLPKTAERVDMRMELDSVRFMMGRRASGVYILPGCDELSR